MKSLPEIKTRCGKGPKIEKNLVSHGRPEEAFETGLVENVFYKTMNPIEETLSFDPYSRDRGWGKG
jgi:hypothetical protein